MNCKQVFVSRTGRRYIIVSPEERRCILAQRAEDSYPAISEDLTAESLCGISNVHGEGKLSDHFGVLVALSARDIPPAPSMANEV